MANKQLIINSEIDTEQKVLGLLACIAQEQKVEMTRLLKPTELSMVQLMLLHALDFAPDHTLTVNQLKQTMVDESPNVSRALNKLVDKEYVTKKRCEKDQRTVFITATEKGLQAHRDGDKALMTMSVNLSNDEITQLYGLLKKL